MIQKRRRMEGIFRKPPISIVPQRAKKVKGFGRDNENFFQSLDKRGKGCYDNDEGHWQRLLLLERLRKNRLMWK